MIGSFMLAHSSKFVNLNLLLVFLTGSIDSRRSWLRLNLIFNIFFIIFLLPKILELNIDHSVENTFKQDKVFKAPTVLTILML